MINLIIDSSIFNIPATEVYLEFIRLKCLVGFKERGASSYRFTEGIVDTGAYVSVLPLGISQRIEKTIAGKYKMKGLNTKEECAIPVDVGKTKCVLFDKQGNCSEKLEISCYFAQTDEVPVILGFADLLTRYELKFDYKKKIALLL